MGDTNQFEFVRRNRASLAGPALEVGAMDYGSAQDYRSLYPGETFVTTDMIAGPTVDIVTDLTAPFATVDRAFAGARFGVIICMSVLEHCKQPFAMADNLEKLLTPRGKLVVSVPFAWQFHGYPSDYWRFTHEGVKVLFPHLAFESESSCAATSHELDFRPLNDKLGRIDILRRGGRLAILLRRIIQWSVALSGVRSPSPEIAKYPYVLAPTNVNMIGTLCD